jgi:hypothetical protein
MKCVHCGKTRDEIDSACKMCSLCGWSIETEAAVAKETVEQK